MKINKKNLNIIIYFFIYLIFSAHSPWGQYLAYREQHLLIMSTREDIATYPYSKILVDVINKQQIKDIKISCETLYQRLKEKDVYIIPGHNFFISIEDDWPHKHECIRINYATDETSLRKGLEAIKLVMAE